MEEQNTNIEEQNSQLQDDVKVKKHKPFKRFIFVGVGVVLAVAAAYLIHDALLYQTTDDAYVETTTVQVAPRVSGQIIASYVTDNQKVKEGDLVAKIDPADYEVALAQAEAKYQRILLDQKNAQANFKAMQTNIAVAKKDLDRYTNLYEKGAVSKQTLDAAQAKYDSAQANLTQAEESLLSKGGGKVADADLKEVKALRDIQTFMHLKQELYLQDVLKKVCM